MAFNSKELGATHHQKSISWDERDVIIYAIATGHTRHGIHAQNLNLVYEKNLQVVPAFATALARNAAPTLADLGADYTRVVLAGTEARFLQPLPPAGTAHASTRVVAVSDKGRAKGAIITMETRLSIDDTDYVIVLTQQMARGDGGCGEYAADNGITLSKGVKPERLADHTLNLTTRSDQAALYRLLGDHNPLHIDPDAASASGFPCPILHGLCTYGIAFQAASTLLTTAIGSFTVRFSAPVYPGEPLLMNLWQERDQSYFELLAPERQHCVTVSGVAKQHG